MRPSAIVRALKMNIEQGLVSYMQGPPGVGKTATMYKLAEELGRPVITLILSQLDAVDLRGLPTVNGDGLAHFAPPSFLPRKGHMDNCILFLDELPQAPILVQNASLQLTLERRLGEYRLPEGVDIIAAGNRQIDRAGSQSLTTALKSRLVTLDFEPHLDDLIEHGLQAGWSPEVLAFLRHRPDLMHAFDPQRHSEAFPCPRTWDFVQRLVKAKPDKEIELEMFKGCIGEGAANEFTGFLRICNRLQNPDYVLSNPDIAEVSNDPAINFAMCAALAHRANEKNFDNLVTYANRMSPEFSVMLIRDCIRRNGNLIETKAFIDWTTKHQDLMW